MISCRHKVNGHARGHTVPLFRASTLLLALFLLGLASTGKADETTRATRDLLELVPSDARLILTIDDLRGQARTLLDSGLARQFQALPAVKAWFDSEKYSQLEAARNQIEDVLQISLTEIRDQILGDGVVVAIQVPLDPPLDPTRVHGVLIVQARDPALLGKFIDVVNTTQQRNGEITAVAERRRGQTAYHIRQFPAGSNRKADAYVSFPDGTFAISNDESLIHHVIDRKLGKPPTESQPQQDSLGIRQRLTTVDAKLPAKAAARLVVDGRLAESLFKNAAHASSPATSLVDRYADRPGSCGSGPGDRSGSNRRSHRRALRAQQIPDDAGPLVGREQPKRNRD